MILLALKTAWDVLKALATPRNLIVVAVAALALFAWIQSKQLTAARAALVDPVTKVTWQREAVDARSGLAACKSAVETQNKAVDALKAKSDAIIAKADKAAQDARAVAASARHEAERILNQHLTGATACERAEDARMSFLETLR